MDPLALALMVLSLIVFVFAAIGRELRHYNEISLGLVLLVAALICQFINVTSRTISNS